MTEFNVLKWENYVSKLKEFDLVGGWWNATGGLNPFFEGTFWWARLDWVRGLGLPDNNDRYDAELWIGKSQNPRVYDWVVDFKYE